MLTASLQGVTWLWLQSSFRVIHIEGLLAAMIAVSPFVIMIIRQRAIQSQYQSCICDDGAPQRMNG